MEAVLLAFVVCASNAFCFILGTKVGRGKVDTIKHPLIPKKNKSSEIAKHEQENLNTILQNIENYDGTPMGQKDLPWRL